MDFEILEKYDDWLKEYREVWLAHFEATGETKWDVYNKPNNKTAPAGKGIDLSNSRLLLISSAGSYLKDDHDPYDHANKLGDYTIRQYSIDTAFDALEFAHDHYNHEMVLADPQVLIPIQHLKDMVSEGKIGELAPQVISFQGYQPDASRVVDETAPAILAAAKEMNADAALLVPS